MWMAGYGSRNKPSEGAVHDLWAKALALQDPAGRACWSRSTSAGSAATSRRRSATGSNRGTGAPAGAGRPRLLAHPLRAGRRHQPPDHVQARRRAAGKIKDYARFLAQTAARSSTGDGPLEPVQLAWETGRCDFAVNRRNNKEKDVPAAARAMELHGARRPRRPGAPRPRPGGKLVAVVFGYACHCTVLDFYKFCGDYAGFAQIEIEAALPRVAGHVRRGLRGRPEPAPAPVARAGPGLRHAARRRGAACWPRRCGRSRARSARVPEIDLAFGPLPGREQVEKDTVANFYIASRARLLLEQIERRASSTGLPLSRPGLGSRRPDVGLPGGRGDRRLPCGSSGTPAARTPGSRRTATTSWRTSLRSASSRKGVTRRGRP